MWSYVSGMWLAALRASASNGKRPPCNGGARPSGVGTDMLRIICSQLVPQYTTELADFQFFRDLQGVFARSDASDSCSTFWVCRGSFLQTFRYWRWPGVSCRKTDHQFRATSKVTSTILYKDRFSATPGKSSISASLQFSITCISSLFWNCSSWKKKFCIATTFGVCIAGYAYHLFYRAYIVPWGCFDLSLPDVT